MQSLFSSDELELEYPTVYGISSSAKPLRLAHTLSKCVDIEIVAVEDVFTYDGKSAHQTFEITYLDDGYKCLLIRNKGTQGFFYKKFKNIDFLLCSMEEENINTDLINIIAKQQAITICFALEQPNQIEILNFTQLL